MPRKYISLSLIIASVLGGLLYPITTTPFIIAVSALYIAKR